MSNHFEEVQVGERQDTKAVRAEAEKELRVSLQHPKDLILDASMRLEEAIRGAGVDMGEWLRRRKEGGKAHPQEAIFRKAFGDSKVESDLQTIALREDRFRKIFTESPLARSVELLCVAELWNLDWFGPFEKVYVTPGSEYDDFTHMTDLIVEFVHEEGGVEKPIFLAVIDVTMNNNPEVLSKKWSWVQDLIAKKRLGGFEYYLSPRTKKPEPKMEGVPHVVLYIPKDVAERLVVLSQLRAKYIGKPKEKIFEQMLSEDGFRHDFQAEILVSLLRSRDFAINLSKGMGLGFNVQKGNIEILETAIKHLQTLGYPGRISDQEIRKTLEGVFSSFLINKAS